MAAMASEARGAGAGTVERRNDWIEVDLGGARPRLFVRNWIPPEPNGYVVICVHGLTCTGAGFAFLGRYLARRGYHVVAADLFGHGRSTWLGPGSVFGTGPIARCLRALASHYADKGSRRIFLGSSAGAGYVSLFLGASRIEAAAVVINDLGLEWNPALGDGAKRLLDDVALRFDTIAEAKAHVKRRDEEVFGHRDTEEIAPPVLDRYLASFFQVLDGRYAFAVDREMLAHTVNGPEGRAPYPDFYRAISNINSPHILLLFGEHSAYRRSAVRRRLTVERPHIVSVNVPGAGHSPRLLCPRQAHIVHRFLDRAQTG